MKLLNSTNKENGTITRTTNETKFEKYEHCAVLLSSLYMLKCTSYEFILDD